MGSFLDSLRFRKEIALDLGIGRQQIHGFMIGEHGANMIPLWSNIHIYGFHQAELHPELSRIRQGFRTENFHQDVQAASGKLRALLRAGQIRDAYTFIRQYPPDIRVALTSFITHFSGAKTMVGTARTTMQFIRTLTSGNDALVAGQISLEGDFHGIHSTLGIPFVIGNKGVDRIIQLQMDAAEQELLCHCAEQVCQKLAAVNV